MAKTSIPWASDSWNYIRAVDPATGKTGWHCVRIDLACKFCYAAAFNRRGLNVGTGLDYVATSPAKLYLDQTILRQPLGWTKSKAIFPCSMTDWAGADVGVQPEWVWAALSIAAACPRHTFLFLTKRPQWLVKWLDLRSGRAEGEQMAGVPFPRAIPSNVWIGCSAGTQATWDKFAPCMAEISALGWNTWVSFEPLLEAIDIGNVEGLIKWAVIGGESGPKARPCNLAWQRQIIRDLLACKVLAFEKQLGRYPVGDWGDDNRPMGNPNRWVLVDAKGEDPAEWPRDLRVRQHPANLQGMK